MTRPRFTDHILAAPNIVESIPADSVWRVFPVGTERRLRSGRVAYQPLGFNSLALRTALDLRIDRLQPME